MSNPYYVHSSGTPPAQQRGQSAPVRAEFDAIENGFDSVEQAILNVASGAINTALPSQTGNAGRALVSDGMNVTWGQVAYFDPVNFYMGVGTVVPDATITVSTNAAALPLAISGTVVHLGAADGETARALLDAFGSNAVFSGRRANGTAAAPAALQTDQTIVALAANGYGATGYTATNRGSLQIAAAQNWTDTNQGTKAVFRVTPNNTITPVIAAYIDQDSSLHIPTVTATTAVTAPTIVAATSVTAPAITSSTLITANNLSATAIVGGSISTAGSMTAPTRTAGDNTTAVATTAFIAAKTAARSVFSYSQSASQTGGTDIVFNTALFALHGSGTFVGGVFTTAAAGFYQFTAEITIDNATGLSGFQLMFIEFNAVPVARSSQYVQTGGGTTFLLDTGPRYLAAGVAIKVVSGVALSASYSTSVAFGLTNVFSGCLIDGL